MEYYPTSAPHNHNPKMQAPTHSLGRYACAHRCRHSPADTSPYHAHSHGQRATASGPRPTGHGQQDTANRTRTTDNGTQPCTPRPQHTARPPCAYTRRAAADTSSAQEYAPGKWSGCSMHVLTMWEMFMFFIITLELESSCPPR
jgi:hypothetical protein